MLEGEPWMKTILIIDDSQTVRMQLRSILESVGFSVEEAIDGQSGYNKIMALPKIDLLITDYNMPGSDGLSMLESVKTKMGGKLSFPTFVMTTETSESLKQTGKNLGVLAWINKPFSPDKLVAAIQKVTNFKSAAS